MKGERATAGGFASRVASGLVWGQIGMSGRTLISFVISLLVARSLGVQGFGVFAALGTLVNVVVQATEMGMPAVISNYLPQYRGEERPGEGSYLVRRVLASRIVLLLVAIVLLNAFSAPLTRLLGAGDGEPYVRLVSLWVLVRGIMDVLLFAVTSTLEMRRFTFVEISISILQLIGTIVLAALGMTISSVVVLMIAVNALQLAGYAFCARDVFRPKPVPIDLLPILKFGATLWISNFMHYVRYKSIDVFMILYFLRDPEQVGYYEVAYVLTIRVAYVLLTSLDRLALPIYSESYARSGLEGLRRAWELLTKLSIYLAVPVTVFLLCHADTLVRLLYSEAFADSASLVRVLCFFSAIGFLGASLTSAPIVLPLERQGLHLYVGVAAAAVNVVLNAVLIPTIGLTGAVLATGVAMLTSTAAELLIARALIRARLPFRFIAQTLVCVGAAVSWTLLFESASLWAVTGMALVYAATVTFLLARLQPLTAEESRLLARLSPTAHALLGRFGLLR